MNLRPDRHLRSRGRDSCISDVAPLPDRGWPDVRRKIGFVLEFEVEWLIEKRASAEGLGSRGRPQN